MRKIIKKAAAVVLALFITLPVFTAPSSAATAITVTGGENITGGETFNVTITYSGDSVGRVIADLSYDTSMLTYLSGGSSMGNTGYVVLKNAGTGEDITFNLEFQALKEGTTSLKIETREMYDLNEEYMDNPSASKSITITGNVSEEEIVEPTMPEEEDVTPNLIAVDEKEDETNSTMVLVAGAVIVSALILLIVLLMRRRK